MEAEWTAKRESVRRFNWISIITVSGFGKVLNGISPLSGVRKLPARVAGEQRSR
jgi:hypothetical protein